eukprot:14539009-Ditylum_brightwellii.AAC.1
MSAPSSPGGGAGVRAAAPRAAALTGLNAADAALVAVVAIRNACIGATKCFSENLYKENINLGTKHGMVLFEAATKPVPSDQCIDITVLNVQKILDLFEDLSSLYRWSHINGKIKNAAEDKMKLLIQYNCLMLDNLKRHTNWYYSGNPASVAVTTPVAM